MPMARPIVHVRLEPGFPTMLDRLAERAGAPLSFLRAAWYAAGGVEGRTLIASDPEGRPIAAIPVVAQPGTAAAIRAVPGSYWPFRSILLDPEAGADALVAFLADPQVQSGLGALWRLGPVYLDDPACIALREAAASAGWTILSRPLGRTFLLDLAGEDGEAWPRRSTHRRLASRESRLARSGPLEIRHVKGRDWDEATLDRLARIEAQSWIARDTDGKGAKFLRPAQRDYWRRVTRDPVLAESLSATLLIVGGEPAAFSFDLKAGDLQYSLASSYALGFAAARPGWIVTARQLQWAAAQGVVRVDLGAGDSGYKREMGAVPGSEIGDLLIVRNRQVARLARGKWGGECALARRAYVAAGHDDGPGLARPLLAAGAAAAAIAAMAE